MQSVGRRYAQYFNKRYDRSGALWEDRYKAAVVDSEAYLLICYRYIELNPVRAAIVTDPRDYPYSSFHRNALGKPDPMVTPHQIYRDLVGEASEKVAATGLHRYRALFDTALTHMELDAVRQGTQKRRFICGPDFREQDGQQGVGVDHVDSDP
jgi:putative transposase